MRREVEVRHGRSSRASVWVGRCLLVALAQLPLLACGARFPAVRSNVVLIVVDALRADHLGCYGYERASTPNIDRLAEHGLLFRNAYSVASWTVPSSASLFTSTLPVVHRANRPPDERNAFSVLADDYLLFNEVLQREGYATAVVTTIGWVSPNANYDQGVEEYVRSERRDADVFRLAREVVSERRQRPFHLYIHLIDVHDYYHPDRLFDEEITRGLELSDELLSLSGLRSRQAYERLARELAAPGVLTEDDLELLIRSYDRELERTDRLIGGLIDHLRSQGLAEETLIVLTSDHGEQFLEHGALMHASDRYYNEVLRVPLIFSAPSRFDRPLVSDVPVSTIDVVPTIFALLGIDRPSVFQGESVLGMLDEDRPVFTTNGRTWKVITREWSYIYSPQGRREELYRLSDDPGESRDLAGEPRYSEVAARLRRLVREKIEDSAGHEYLRQVPVPGLEQMTEEEVEALRALGYLD